VPFRQSSFFFGRRGSFGAHERPPPRPDSAEESELHRQLLEGAAVDVESCYDDTFAFSWKRLLLHVGCVPACGTPPFALCCSFSLLLALPILR
jgi:hypothetical protein